MSLDWIINYFQCQSLLDEQNTPRSFTEAEVQQNYLSQGTIQNMLWLSFFSPYTQTFLQPSLTLGFWKEKDVLGRWFWKGLFHNTMSPLGIFCVPLRPLHLPFAQITLEKQMLKNITRIRKQKIINHTKKNTSTVLRFRKYSTL